MQLNNQGFFIFAVFPRVFS